MIIIAKSQALRNLLEYSVFIFYVTLQGLNFIWHVFSGILFLRNNANLGRIRMALGHWIAIAITIISLIVVIVVAVKAKNDMSPTLENIEEFKKNVDAKSEHFKNEGEHLERRISELSGRAEIVQEEIKIKQKEFEYFMDHQDELVASVQTLQEVAPEYAKKRSGAMIDDVKRDVPKISKTLKLALKKTADKRQARERTKENMK